MSNDKYYGNCKHFKNEDIEGFSYCEIEHGFKCCEIEHGFKCCDEVCVKHEAINNCWTEITPDNVGKIKSIESNRVIICASNSIGYMYPSTLLSLACSLESIADYGGITTMFYPN